MKRLGTPLSRRRFLQGACLAGAAAVIGGSFAPLEALAAGRARHTEQQTRLLMGTFVTLTAVTKDKELAHSAFAAAFTEMERLIAVFDRHDGASVISGLNAGGSLAGAPAELSLVLARAMAFGRLTGDVFNPAIAPVVDLFASAQGGRLPRLGDEALGRALELARPGGIVIDANGIRFARKGMRLTLDGIAKGYIADAASQRLAALGLADHMVNAGGDVRCFGRNAQGKAWSVGVQHPSRAGDLLDVAALHAGGALATSGSYENYYDRARTRHHLISHLTGRSGENLSVTVRAQSAMEADALATSLALMAPGEAIALVNALPGTGCLILDRAGRRFTGGAWA